MNIMVFDTETIGLEKCFCYDIGYIILDTETKNVLAKNEFIIEQVWNNKQLFETAYYSDKKELYVSKMRGRKAKLVNWGLAISKIIKNIKDFNVESIYAYNSNFDTKVIDFNAEWYKTRNFLDYTPIYDIWGYTSELITKGLADNYVEFCEQNALISESGNIHNNADSWGKFFNGLEWNEEHTALSDSEIESKILLYCIENGLELNKEYKVVKCIESETPQEKELIIDYKGNEIIYNYTKKTEYKKNGWKIKLK